MLINEIDLNTDDQKEEAIMLLRKVRRAVAKNPNEFPSWLNLIQSIHGMLSIVWPVQNTLIKTPTPFLKNLTVVSPIKMSINGNLRYKIVADGYISLYTDMQKIEGYETLYKPWVRRYLADVIRKGDPIFHNIVSTDIDIRMVSVHGNKQYWQIKINKIISLLQPDFTKHNMLLSQIMNSRMLDEFKKIISS